MKVSIRKKLMMSFGILILLMIACHMIFDTFLAKKIFIYEKSKVLESSFEKMKENYSANIEEVEKFAEDIQNENGIRILIFKKDEVIYNNQHANANKQGYGKTQKKNLEEEEYSETPKVEIKEENYGEHLDFLQISGKFFYEKEIIFVQMMIPMLSIDNSVAIFTKSEIYISMVILGVSFLVAFFLSKNITLPITNIEKASKHIAESDFSYRADENVSLLELQSLSRSINVMSDKLMKSMNDLQEANNLLKEDIDYQKKIEMLRKEFIASVSHDMKTPLSLLQIYTENLKSNDMEIDRDFYYDTILEETKKLSDMISRMLEISSLDCGFTKLNYTNFDFSELLIEIIQQYQPMLKNFAFSSDIKEELYIDGDERYLEQCIKNIMNNALQYTKKNAKIVIRLMDTMHGIQFCVFNEGTHISEKNIEHIWDAFFREDEARTRTQNNNVGLGLYIVKTIVNKHGGKSYAENIDCGVQFIIELPKEHKDSVDVC